LTTVDGLYGTKGRRRRIPGEAARLLRTMTLLGWTLLGGADVGSSVAVRALVDKNAVNVGCSALVDKNVGCLKLSSSDASENSSSLPESKLSLQVVASTPRLE
jgi:hypothetical protein